MSTTLDLPVIDPRIALAASTDVDGSLPEETLPSSGDSAAPSDSRWVRPAVLLLLLATGFLYFWDLSASGYANSFYAAAVQAGTKSWKAFFFGSLDSSNFITVDKPPGSLWLMELSGRIFGFSSWSMLVPEALAGVASVGLLYAGVKRWFGARAGLLAGAILAVTPVAALMFRFNNPDALLVLLLVASAYTLVRAMEKGGTRWLVATGALLGFAFLVKLLQAFTVLPAFYLVYLIAAPGNVLRRVRQLAICTVAIVVSAGWWIATVALWPVGSRPMIDGSPDNSIINLILGYDGLDRLEGASGGQASNFSGATGIFRLFNDLMGGQASWLIPAAVLVALAGLIWRGRAPRADRTRAALLLWGGWLLVTGAVFSLSRGTIHTYYTVALAPAIAALVAIGAVIVWEHRKLLAARVLGAVGIFMTTGWAYVLLDRTPTFYPWLRVVVLVAGALSGFGLLAAPFIAQVNRRLVLAVVALGLVACLAGPLAFTGATVTTAHTGSIPSAGPSAGASGGLGAGAGAGGGNGANFGGSPPSGSSITATRGSSTAGRPAGTPPAGTRPSGSVAGGSTTTGGASFGSRPSGSATASGGTTPTSRSSSGSAPTAIAGGGGGGLVTASAALVAALKSDASSYRWVAATFGSQSAATLELASGGEPVMAIGGFNGNGGNLTLAQFESYVAKGDIHYFIASGAGAGQGGGSSNSDSAITSWVEAHYSAKTIGGQALYDLSSGIT